MQVTIMDGGMGGEIRMRMENAGGGLWSARALLEDPDLVVQIHREFIEAGARMIITNSYATVPFYLSRENLDHRFAELTERAGLLARRAVIESGKAVSVAGSLPPLDESYRPDLVPPASRAAPIYEALVKALAETADFYLCETMSSAAEAHIAASAAVRHGGGKPVWVAWTLDETPGAGLRSGEDITTAFEQLADLPIAGFMFNCTQPEAIEAGLTELRPLTDKPVGCYANRLNRVPEDWELDRDGTSIRRDDFDTASFVESGLRAIRLGASVVGGCCGIAPRDIAALTEAVVREQVRGG